VIERPGLEEKNRPKTKEMSKGPPNITITGSASILLPKFKGFVPIKKLEDHYTVARDLVSNIENEKH
jgi:hypothetical protein